jgi:hypothetical protein
MTRTMQYVYAVIALLFVVIALLHVPHPSPWLWLPYALGAALAGVALISNLSIMLSRLLAIGATALMFFFFAGFFMAVPNLSSDWYQSQEGWLVVTRLLGAFTLIPLLSGFSCRCKAEDGVARHRSADAATGSGGFFTAPEQPRPRSS